LPRPSLLEFQRRYHPKNLEYVQIDRIIQIRLVVVFLVPNPIWSILTIFCQINSRSYSSQSNCATPFALTPTTELSPKGLHFHHWQSAAPSARTTSSTYSTVGDLREIPVLPGGRKSFGRKLLFSLTNSIAHSPDLLYDDDNVQRRLESSTVPCATQCS
jgi:hypothetical protein